MTDVMCSGSSFECKFLGVEGVKGLCCVRLAMWLVTFPLKFCSVAMNYDVFSLFARMSSSLQRTCPDMLQLVSQIYNESSLKVRILKCKGIRPGKEKVKEGKHYLIL